MGRLTEMIQYLNCDTKDFGKLMRKDKDQYVNFSSFNPKPEYTKYRALQRKNNK